jgi:hypothetical protein
MKTITPISIWVNGVQQLASILNAYVISDNLSTQATFYFALYFENSDLTLGIQLTNGNLYMSGTPYTQYETNQYAWDWIAQQLNVTITGDYTPPGQVTETTSAPIETDTTTAEPTTQPTTPSN